MKVSYYPGCSLEGTAREYNDSIRDICKALDIELADLDDWNCCGSSSAHMMNDVLAHELPLRNLKIAQKAGLDVLVPCASCFNRLKAVWQTSKNGSTIKVKHVLDVLNEPEVKIKIKEKIKKNLKKIKPVAYYGCLITRHPKVTEDANYENPTSMDEILKLIDTDVCKWAYKTDCCGGSLTLTRADLIHKLTEILFSAAKEAGANCIVTACPMCQANLDMRQGELKTKYNLPVFYISELIGAAIDSPNHTKWWKKHFINPERVL